MRSLRICVIGAGLSGLVTSRTLRDCGHAVSVFEKADSIGGVWHPANRYPGLRTQSPRDCYAFSDFPMPRDYPEFPDGDQVHRYLLAYADHHGLLSHISLATSVIAITRGEDGAWDVRLRQHDGRKRSESFDFVIACNGVFSRPHIPQLPGRAAFEATGGSLLHSSQVRDLEPLRGRDVVVVGFGKSALDIAEAALPVARSTAIVCNRTLWKVPRYLLGFINAKHLILSRYAELWLPHYTMRGWRRFLHERLPRLVDFYWLMSERSIGRHLGLLQKRLRPQLPLRASIGACFGLAPTDNFRALRSGRIGLHRERIASFSSAGLCLADGTTVPAQTIVFATGFTQDCPFLSPTDHAALFVDGTPRLYRLLLSPRIPRFAVNGFNGGGASQLTAEIGARWLAAMLAGDLKPPDVTAMEAQIDRDLAQQRHAVAVPRGLGLYASPFQFAYLDQLLDDMGRPPADSGKSFWRRYFTAIDPTDYALPRNAERPRMPAMARPLSGEPAVEPSLPARISLLRQHGNSTLAYSATFQKGLRHFGDERGFIAFKQVGGTALALSDPIAPRGEWPRLIEGFCAAHKDACFCQISRPAAEVLAQRRFFVNEMGVDTRLDLASYTFDGKEKRNLRMATNRMEKRGYVTRECALSEVDLREVWNLSEAWRDTRTIKRREVVFLNRPFDLGDEPDVRRFFTFDASGKLVALGFFDPLYENGEVIGYSTSFKRRLPEADLKAGQAITRLAIEQFQREGRKYVFLGLSPMADIADRDFRCNPMVAAWFRFAYRNRLFNRYLYNLQGHAEHKREFRGEALQTYFASDKILALPRLFMLMVACDIFGWPGLGLRPRFAPSRSHDAAGAI